MSTYDVGTYGSGTYFDATSVTVRTATPITFASRGTISKVAPLVTLALSALPNQVTQGYGFGAYGSGFYGGFTAPPVPSVPDFPQVICEIAFATNPFDTSQVWTDVSTYLRAFSTNRGRQFELDRFQSGTASVVLDNRTRRFDPAYSASPYAPNVLPGKRLRLRAVWNSLTYTIFHGFIEAWPQLSRPPRDGYVELRAADGFKMLALPRLTTTYSATTTTQRVTAVLNDVGWPLADRRFIGGTTSVQATALQNVTALEHLYGVAEAESGRFFIDADGKVAFFGREVGFLPPYNTSRATFGDNRADSTQYPYSDIVPVFDDVHIWNEVRLTRINGAEQVASDATSRTKFGPRTLQQQSLLLPTDADVLSLAQYRLGQFKNPVLRIETLRLQAQRDAQHLWPEVLGREIGDRIRVGRTPQGLPPPIAQDCWIEGIAHAATPRRWTTTWNLSRADTSSYWVLGDATQGVLGVSTYLSF